VRRGLPICTPEEDLSLVQQPPVHRIPIAFVVVLALASACTASHSGADNERVSGSGSQPIQPAVSSPPPCSDQAKGAGFTIVMRNKRFVPSCVVVTGVDGFRLRNRDSVVHNFTIEGTKLSVDVSPSNRVTEPALMPGVPPGTYRFYCRFHRAQGMIGVIHVLAA